MRADQRNTALMHPLVEIKGLTYSARTAKQGNPATKGRDLASAFQGGRIAGGFDDNRKSLRKGIEVLEHLCGARGGKYMVGAYFFGQLQAAVVPVDRDSWQRAGCPRYLQSQQADQSSAENGDGFSHFQTRLAYGLQGCRQELEKRRALIGEVVGEPVAERGLTATWLAWRDLLATRSPTLSVVTSVPRSMTLPTWL